MPKTFEHLQKSQVEKHREHLANLLSGINDLTVVNQTGLMEYEIWCDNGRDLTEELTAKGIPARHNGGKQVLIFSDEYPFYAQNRVCINKVAKEIIRIAIRFNHENGHLALQNRA